MRGAPENCNFLKLIFNIVLYFNIYKYVLYNIFNDVFKNISANKTQKRGVRTKQQNFGSFLNFWQVTALNNFWLLYIQCFIGI